ESSAPPPVREPRQRRRNLCGGDHAFLRHEAQITRDFPARVGENGGCVVGGPILEGDPRHPGAGPRAREGQPAAACAAVRSWRPTSATAEPPSANVRAI